MNERRRVGRFLERIRDDERNRLAIVADDAFLEQREKSSGRRPGGRLAALRKSRRVIGRQYGDHTR